MTTKIGNVLYIRDYERRPRDADAVHRDPSESATIIYLTPQLRRAHEDCPPLHLNCRCSLGRHGPFDSLPLNRTVVWPVPSAQSFNVGWL